MRQFGAIVVFWVLTTDVLVRRHFNDACQRADERASIASFVGYVRRSLLLSEAADEVAGNLCYVPSGLILCVLRVQLKSARAESGGHEEERHRRPRESDEEEEEDDSEPEPDGAYDYYPNELEEDGGHDEDLDEVHNSVSGACSLGKSLEVTRALSLYYEPQDGEYARRSSFGPRKRKSSSSESSSDAKGGKLSAGSGGGAAKGDPASKKKKRKARLYCVCKGASFGNMIACDSKTCMDRSNWFHMGCVGLDPSEDPPETWFCPTCQEQDLSELPENRACAACDEDGS